MTTLADITSSYDDGDGEGETLHLAALRRLAWRRTHGGKVCSSCKRALQLDAFQADGRESDGKRRVCRECRSIP